MKRYSIQVIIEQDEDGKYIAACPALQGCYTQGDTFEEAIENIKDVIKMCLEELELLPKHKVGRILTSLRREDMYTNAR